MTETRPDRRRFAPAGLLGMVALVGLAEAWLIRREADIGMTSTVCEWRATAAELDDHARFSDVLCFGDSLVKMGLSPVVLSEELGIPASSLAASGGRPPTSYLLFRRAIEAGARPKAVLVDFKWTALESNVRANARVLPEIGDARDQIDVGLSLRDPEFLGSILSAEFLRSYRDRLEVRAALMSAFEGKASNLAEVMRPWYRNWDRNRGAHHIPTRPAYHGEVDLADAAMFHPGWRVDPVNVAYMARFLELAARHQIPVFWLMTPMTAPVHAEMARLGSDAAFTDLARKFAAKYPNLVVLDGRRSDYPSSVFFDATHLAAPGASRFSIDVADAVRTRLGPGASAAGAGDRWVTLPRWRDLPGAVPFEDLTQSAVALQAIDAKARR